MSYTQKGKVSFNTEKVVKNGREEEGEQDQIQKTDAIAATIEKVGIDEVSLTAFRFFLSNWNVYNVKWT